MRGSGHVIAALAFLLCGISPALAGAANAPKGDWIVGPINAASSSGVGYCSMKNDYRNGNSLVFARDAEGSNSLAIDFHKKVLQSGGQYTLTLHVGPLQREMMAIAATPTVLIIQMGLDRDFYSMLQRKASLLVDFQTSQMSFGLDGTQDGLKALTACAQAVGARKHFAQARIPLKAMTDEEYFPGVEPAAGDPVLPPAKFPQMQVAEPGQGAVTGSLGQEVAQATLQDQIELLKAENRKLLLENQRVAESMQREAAPPPVLQAPPSLIPSPGRGDDVTAALAAAQQGIQQALEAQQAQAEEARRQADLAAENARLKASLEAAQSQAEEARRQAAILTENAKLREALALEQKEKQRALELARAQEAEAQQQAAIAAENARLKADLAAAQQERQRALAAAQAAAEAQRQVQPRQAAVKPAAPVQPQQAAITLRQPNYRPDAVVTVQPRTDSRKSLQIVGKPDDFIQQLLTRSHVTGSRDPHNPAAYTWSVGGVYGSAQEQDMSGSSLAKAANEFVSRQEALCKGDFARTVGATKDLNGVQVMEGELACMNGVNDAAAAVLFIARNGRLAVITHEGPPSRMEKALSSRDTMISVLSQ
ncbi:MAG: hypothetical protein EPN97_11050 [Alphaproteobacteria bacterium]|nr:MAG: hypothetical protein EPN97_11050 [Alphaproteobacteria bacterium]